MCLFFSSIHLVSFAISFSSIYLQVSATAGVNAMVPGSKAGRWAEATKHKNTTTMGGMDEESSRSNIFRRLNMTRSSIYLAYGVHPGYIVMFKAVWKKTKRLQHFHLQSAGGCHHRLLQHPTFHGSHRGRKMWISHWFLDWSVSWTNMC